MRCARSQAAANRNGTGKSPNHAASVQGSMSEDEALAHALARSIQELDETHDRNHRRNLEAQQPPTAASTSTTSTTEGGGAASKDKSCSVS